jgi:hypothetical protein
LTCGSSGPNLRPNGPRGRPTNPTPWPVGQVLTRFGPQLRRHVSTREEEGQGGGRHSTRLASHVARPTSRHLASYRVGQVDGAPPQPYKYPPPVKIRTHTPRFRDFTYKSPILSVVARCSLVERVMRL